eukprot:5394436-Prymnesium_polylepis.1
MTTAHARTGCHAHAGIARSTSSCASGAAAVSRGADPLVEEQEGFGGEDLRLGRGQHLAVAHALPAARRVEAHVRGEVPLVEGAA